MRHPLLKPLKFVIRWGIAVGGIWWVVANMTIADHMLVLAGDNRPVQMQVLAVNDGADAVYTVLDPATRRAREVTREESVSRPDRKQVTISEGGKTRDAELLGADFADEGEQGGAPELRRLLVADSPTAPGRWISPSDVVGGYHLKVPNPRVEIGIANMVRRANPWLLALSVSVFPITILVTSIRWKELMRAVEIDIPLTRAFSLNMVGLFYNTFIPAGSTGGDVLKAYYASRHTEHKVRAVMSVVVDRIIGLVVLIILGGIMSLVFYLRADKTDPAGRACMQVAMASGMILVAMAAGLVVFANPRLRRASGLDFVLSRLPMQKQVGHALETMAIYRQRPGLVLWAMVITVPVHLTVMVAAMIAGKAFGLPLSTGYYFVVVPVTVLVGAIPISPQGAGVMEYFAIKLTARQGATVAQAFALTMSIRLQQIFWNLIGGIFVATGHYRPQHKCEDEPEAEDAASRPG